MPSLEELLVSEESLSISQVILQQAQEFMTQGLDCVSVQGNGLPLEFWITPQTLLRMSTAQQEMTDACSLSPEEADRRAQEQYKESIARYHRYKQQRERKLLRIEALQAALDKVQSPVELAAFNAHMAQNLQNQLDNLGEMYDEPIKESGLDYQKKLIESAESSITYARQEYQKQLKLVKSWNIWLDKVRQMLE